MHAFFSHRPPLPDRAWQNQPSESAVSRENPTAHVLQVTVTAEADGECTHHTTPQRRLKTLLRSSSSSKASDCVAKQPLSKGGAGGRGGCCARVPVRPSGYAGTLYHSRKGTRVPFQLCYSPGTTSRVMPPSDARRCGLARPCRRAGAATDAQLQRAGQVRRQRAGILRTREGYLLPLGPVQTNMCVCARRGASHMSSYKSFYVM